MSCSKVLKIGLRRLLLGCEKAPRICGSWLQGSGRCGFDAYPQDTIGVPSQPSVRSTVDSAVLLPRYFVFDGTRYWGVDAADRIGNTLVDILNGLETFHGRSVATSELLAQRMVNTRNEIQSGLRLFGDLVNSVGAVAIETNEIVESIRTPARESKEGVREKI